MLLEELKKPKSKQALSEDLFIEMEKALKTVERAMPDLVADKDAVRDTLLLKYRSEVINNIVDFRKVGKIARAEKIGADIAQARRAIKRLFTEKGYSIDRAWTETVSEVYADRDIVARIEALIAKLNEIKATEVDDDVRERLEELVERAQAIIGSAA